MVSEQSTSSPSTQSRPRFLLVLLAVAGGAVLLTLWIKNSLPQAHSGLPAGETVPALQAAGWLNGDAPSETPKPGTIRVLHAWFTNCPACYKESEELVRLHETYHDQGVEFVGLTYEPVQRLGDIQHFLTKTGITWVNGYGALETLQEMNVEYFPSLWIVNSQGKILWNADSKKPLAEAIPLAIAGELNPKK